MNVEPLANTNSNTNDDIIGDDTKRLEGKAALLNQRIAMQGILIFKVENHMIA